MIVSDRNVPPSADRPFLTGSLPRQAGITVDTDDQVVLRLAGSHLGRGPECVAEPHPLDLSHRFFDIGEADRGRESTEDAEDIEDDEQPLRPRTSEPNGRQGRRHGPER